MIYYTKVINESTGLCDVGTGTNTAYYKSIGMELMDVKQSDIDGAWYLTDKCQMKTEEQKELEEKERVGNLKCTKRVFALMLQELGVDYLTVLLPLIESNSQAKLEWDLCVELERKNPLLDVMAGQLGITPDQLDGLFKYANGEITIEEFKALLVKPDEELPTDEIVLPDEDIEDESTPDIQI